MEEEQEKTNWKKLKMEMFELEKPEEAKKLEIKIKKKMEKTYNEIEKVVETEIGKFLEEKMKNNPKMSYIG